MIAKCIELLRMILPTAGKLTIMHPVTVIWSNMALLPAKSNVPGSGAVNNSPNMATIYISHGV